MAKYCDKCGAKLDEKTGLCPNCVHLQKNQIDSSRKIERGVPKASNGVNGTGKTKKQLKKEIKQNKKIEKKAKKKEQWKELSIWKKTRKIVCRILIFILCISIISVLGLWISKEYYGADLSIISEIYKKYALQSDNSSYYVRDNTLGPGYTKIQIKDENSAIAAAQDAVKILKLGNVADDLLVQDVSTVDDLTYYRLQQRINGVPVYGNSMVVIADNSQNAAGFTTNCIPLSETSFENPPSTELFQKNIVQYLIDGGYYSGDTKVVIEQCSDKNKVYYVSGAEAIPAYLLQISFGENIFSSLSVMVNSNDGKVINVLSSVYEDDIEPADISTIENSLVVNGAYNKASNMYEAFDTERSIQIYNLERTNSKIEGATITYLTSENSIFGDTEEEIRLEQDKGLILLNNVQKCYDFYQGLSWRSLPRIFGFYNDSYDDGKNALGGIAKGDEDFGVSGGISMGWDTGVNCLDTIGHEFTHVVSQSIVDWKYVEEYSKIPDPQGAINEGYSDIFGEIIESKITGKDPDWVHGSRIINNPRSGHYPAAVGDKKFKSIAGHMWGMEIANGKYSDYSHGFSTIISHCAYLMTTGVNESYKKLDIDQLAKLWYNTLFTLPADCSFIVLRQNMELTARILGYNSELQECISAAFDQVGIKNQSESEETYSPESELSVLDKNGDIYPNSHITIIGQTFTGPFKTGLWTQDYFEEMNTTARKRLKLSLPIGDYKIIVKDTKVEYDSSYEKNVKIRSKAINKDIIVTTNFGEDSIVEDLSIDSSSNRDIVLLLDTSGSMSGEPLDETKKAAIKFVDTLLEENANIGLVTYDNSATVHTVFTKRKQPLIDEIYNLEADNGTNIEAGLSYADAMLSTSKAEKKIIVLMSDGLPNDGKQGDELISYAEEIKKKGTIIYTLGFFENIDYDKSTAQKLLEDIATDGCHYEVANAEDLVFFFNDIADQINGQKYIYIRIACPVDVSVTYEGETLSSNENSLKLRTGYGTLTFEENGEVNDNDSDDRIKVLRLKEDYEYEINITGTGRGTMNYTIAFMDEEGNYDDFRRFEDIKITPRTQIDTIAKNDDESILNIDDDGDGKYDTRLKAVANGVGEEVAVINIYYVIFGIVCGLIALLVILILIRRSKKYK